MSTVNPSQYSTIKSLNTLNPEVFSESRLRWWINRRAENGLADSGALFWSGRRIFIHTEKFLMWFESRKPNQNN